MRRPEVELSDDAAAFVERHLDLAETLAGRADDRSADTPEISNLRAQVRTRIREQLAAFDPDRARADGDAFLARYSLR